MGARREEERKKSKRRIECLNMPSSPDDSLSVSLSSFPYLRFAWLRKVALGGGGRAAVVGELEVDILEREKMIEVRRLAEMTIDILTCFHTLFSLSIHSIPSSPTKFDSLFGSQSTSTPLERSSIHSPNQLSRSKLVSLSTFGRPHFHLQPLRALYSVKADFSR